MATLVGTVMVSYTKARAQSIGVSCEIGLMERPERIIVLIAGGLFNLLTPTMIALAVLTNVTALQRILYVRRAGAEKAHLQRSARSGRTLNVRMYASRAAFGAASRGPFWRPAGARPRHGRPAGRLRVLRWICRCRLPRRAWFVRLTPMRG